MREIKFRAWHKKMRSMDEVMTFNDKSREIGIYNLGDFHLDEVEVMQYTGIKDDNEVDLYENDIIKFDYWYSEATTGYIRYCEDYGAYYVFCIGEDEEHLLRNLSNDVGFEIIGNIYENKEMLK